MDYFLHNTAVVDSNVKIGSGTKIWHFSHISENVVIGKNVVIGQNVFIDKNVKIGDNCKIQNNVSVYKGVFIGNNVFIGPSVVFTNDKYPNSKIWSEEMIIETYICDDVSIGANSTILCGVTLNDSCMIGAGSLVLKSVRQNYLAFGHPAKEIKKIENK